MMSKHDWFPMADWSWCRDCGLLWDGDVRYLAPGVRTPTSNEPACNGPENIVVMPGRLMCATRGKPAGRERGRAHVRRQQFDGRETRRAAGGLEALLTGGVR